VVKAKGISVTIKQVTRLGKPYWEITHYATGTRGDRRQRELAAQKPSPPLALPHESTARSHS
jgi:hypothetical protein